MRKSITQINKDLDLRRFGKNQYTKAINQIPSGEESSSSDGSGEGGSDVTLQELSLEYGENGTFSKTAPEGTAYSKVTVAIDVVPPATRVLSVPHLGLEDTVVAVTGTSYENVPKTSAISENHIVNGYNIITDATSETQLMELCGTAGRNLAFALEFTVFNADMEEESVYLIYTTEMAG